ncbi:MULTISPECIES: SRPBCC domain-containing protein [unclassified Streptomyces]|uniref:SRPBCC domain-containing protein n=1 Tax=unclassified Streptomyces TaxID=2593676 RepID=UPI0022566A78|nr:MULTISPECIES: SRPBCC domain-containing protein [unclassified Streptomyces]MCX4527397.1 SRPBCC domain-containing protein [Streptomyces sp. NBC_01551]MCX4542022.1 SRPBCC domain-containing protein [Streptomyces sp. NBC_01565]
MPPVSHGTSESRGADRRLLRFELHLPFAYETIWPALTTPDGLRGWLAAADVLERRLGGAVTLRWLNGGPTVSGQVTAWDVERVVEYTLAGPGRIRFHLEPVGTDSTVIRFLNERGGGTDADRLDHLAGWHSHFELLEAALEGRPADWSAWSGARFAELRASYAPPAAAA